MSFPSLQKPSPQEKRDFLSRDKITNKASVSCPTIEKRTAGGSVKQPPGETKEMFEENIERPTSS